MKRIPGVGEKLVEIFSPRGFLVRAAVLAGIFLVCQLAGLREHTTFLSGTLSLSGPYARIPIFFGLLYVVTYIGFTILVPVLLIASGMLTLLGRRACGRSAGKRVN